MKKLSIPFMLPWLVFLVPVNIYIIGDWMNVGVQWALFRYQQSIMGTSLISIGNDINYILMGFMQTRTTVSTVLWILAGCLILISICFLMVDFQRQTLNPYKKPGLLIMFSGGLFLIADFIQYGLTLYSQTGICIPVGIPFLLFIGYWEYRYISETAEPAQKQRCSLIVKSHPINRIFSVYHNSQVFRELVVLAVISIFIKIIVLSLSVFSPVLIVQQDISFYYHYFLNLLVGNVPYYSFSVEYPQFFFLPVIIAGLPTFIVRDYYIFSFSFMMLMCVFDIATMVCVYQIARKIFGPNRAFLCGLLYATAISAIFHIPLTYDIFPTFLLMFALLLFLYRHDTAAYLSATAGALAKWFPASCYPFFFLYSIKNKETLRPSLLGIAVSFGVIIAGTVPFLLLSPEKFLYSYSIHFNRPADSHGLIYYLDAVSNYLFQIQPFSGSSIFIFLIGECLIIAWYYWFLDKKQVTLCSVLFISIFYFVLVNKAGSPNFLIWTTPFLALLLINSNMEIILFYLVEIIIYIESPILTGIIWRPGGVYPVIENAMPSWAFLFYTVKFALFGYVLVYIVRKLYADSRLADEERSEVPE